MRLLKDLFQNNLTVWIYCENETLQKQFLTQAEKEGFHAINGQNPTDLFLHKLYGINDNMTIGYLSAMIWNLTLKNGDDNHLRVDYGKYIAAEEDFFYHS